ncbi:hypothetical protein P9250_06230 [Caballeronia sp. LP006]|jgi:hypothetical protein|uniref:hypothetical protein n=1 Tax=unclassified Caballeronia TaxID=2646786 RepID=UPI001FD2E0DD|nr:MULTISPECIES: hypothetical protein [unclassified Caballeronia]MDR5773899.1 hypothetical protein [Caballeronia sp. LZ002]MDR5799333.1 hypothetical protein [Caballeronia sp. LZ001]MDR5827463.1 hypothetical protein [Caballeronia sp. LP006]MDR5849334.1 hypothetical protein [Caballeronia sp. LZ003]
MPQFLSHYLQAIYAPAGRMRERWQLRSLERARAACGCNATSVIELPDDESTRADRLEHIALYARAGYFNMGYTVDLFQSPADLPPH